MNMNSNGKMNKIILTGLMMAIICVVTMVLPIPIPFTTGYVHLGDGIIFLSVLILGWRYGAIAAGLGSAMADMLIGFAIWAPWTLVIKGGMAIIMGLFLEKVIKHHHSSQGLGISVYSIMGMILGGIFMVAGYYVAEGVIYGNYVAPLLGVPWNLAQIGVGAAMASFMASALYKTSAYSIFTYKPQK